MAAEPNTAPAPAAPSPPAASDPLSRLEAAGIGDDGAEYEDLDALGGDEPAAEGDAEPLEGSGDKPPEEDNEELDEEGNPKQKPEPQDTLGLKGKGTREAPLKHKELPADKFVEVKTASGERVVVNLKDALAGTFMSKDMVSREISYAKEAQQRARSIAERAIEHQKQANAGLQATLHNPEALVKALVERGMPVLHQVAKAYALMRKDPSLREGLLAQIREDRVNAQQQEVERKRKDLERQQHESEQQAQLMRDLAPAYRAGLRAAGILRPQDVTDELRDGIRMRFNFLIGKHNRSPTPEEMRWCVTDAADQLKAKGELKAPQRPRAAPPPPPAPPNQRQSSGKRDWTKVPHEVRMSDPDFLFDRAARELVRRTS